MSDFDGIQRRRTSLSEPTTGPPATLEGRVLLNASVLPGSVVRWVEITRQTAAKCAIAPTMTRRWKISWNPKTRGHGLGRRHAKTAAPAV